ncbi:hypothetical protein LMH87_001670 [Akanthomyces muscarius]|uniref:Uncharacterized protein n=1 Tax=Akanthomyces muscarius TaxID=2231603 RepID=A0A9W8Q6Y8_AKAMU|nr:hypothetical protein LMH87_001670 [Akanthomyces muscarius]KAJ4147123.1 hypothetical protein LMH87_001670 [Akanthomyces muscarius]
MQKLYEMNAVLQKKTSQVADRLSIASRTLRKAGSSLHTCHHSSASACRPLDPPLSPGIQIRRPDQLKQYTSFSRKTMAACRTKQLSMYVRCPDAKREKRPRWLALDLLRIPAIGFKVRPFSTPRQAAQSGRSISFRT